jgi:hypothetical protein
MNKLVDRALYHPSIAGSMFYLADLMVVVDFSLTGAALVLTAKLGEQLLRPISTCNHLYASRAASAARSAHRSIAAVRASASAR